MILYNLSSIARRLDINDHSLRDLYARGVLPPSGFYDERNNPFFTKQQLKEISALLKKGLRKNNSTNLLSQSQVAKLAGVSLNRLNYHIKHKNIPAPTTGCTRRKYYTNDQVASVIQELKKHTSLEYYSRAVAAGYFTSRAAAKYLGMPAITFNYYVYHATKNNIPAATRKVPGYPYKVWSKEDLDGFKQNQLKSYFAKMKKKEAIIKMSQ